jgi:type II secretory pathway component PulF
MALYYYRAFSKAGKKVNGYFDATSTQHVREHLARIELYPTSIELAASQLAQVPFYKRIFQRRITLRDKIFFTKQLAVLLRSGVPLVQALDLLSEQTEGSLQRIVITLRDNIKEGKSLADGLQKYPSVFDSIYIQLVRAGEASGKLEVILERLTDYLVKRDALTKKIRGALTYPLFQLAIIVVVVVALLTFVVPTIADVFTKQKITLPLPTRILIAMSNFLLNHYIILALIIFGVVGIFRLWSRSETGKYTLDRVKLKLPIVGYFTRMGAVVQFCRTLGMLIEGGVNLPEALNIVANIVDNRILAKTLKEARENIIRQGKMAQYLKQTGMFPAMAIYLINTGEQSGQLDSMLLTVAQTYEAELEEYADTLSSAIGPIMLIVMAAIVGFIVASIALPMKQMGDVASKMAGRI